VARREGLSASDEELDAEVQRYADRTGRSVAAVRARLEKEGGIGRLHSGLRREKTVNFLLSKATVIKDR
jgi:trigger factor